MRRCAVVSRIVVCKRTEGEPSAREDVSVWTDVGFGGAKPPEMPAIQISIYYA